MFIICLTLNDETPIPKTAINAADRGTARSACPEKLETWETKEKRKTMRLEKKNDMKFDCVVVAVPLFYRSLFQLLIFFFNFMLIQSKNSIYNKKLHFVVKSTLLPHFSLRMETLSEYSVIVVTQFIEWKNSSLLFWNLKFQCYGNCKKNY